MGTNHENPIFNKAVRGADIARPMDSMELNGVTYALAFDHNAFRVAEDVYELQYSRLVNFADIMTYLEHGKLGAVMALLYGALLSGGAKMTWAEFAKAFRIVDIPGVKEKLMENMRHALPDTEDAQADPQ